MLERLTASRFITAPAIWGKLPAHADFVRSGMRHGESEGWQDWLAQHGQTGAVGEVADLPVSFVLPPGSLAFAPRRFVVGVYKSSRDKVGRPYPVLVYQLARTHWVERHFEQHARCPTDWLFWLGRAVARHTAARDADLPGLERTVRALWQLHAPHWGDLWPARHPAPFAVPARSVLEAHTGTDPSVDPAHQLHGVRHLPWADWPQRLVRRERSKSAFWQQDAVGGFVNAEQRFDSLMKLSP